MADAYSMLILCLKCWVSLPAYESIVMSHRLTSDESSAMTATLFGSVFERLQCSGLQQAVKIFSDFDGDHSPYWTQL